MAKHLTAAVLTVLVRRSCARRRPAHAVSRRHFRRRRRDQQVNYGVSLAFLGGGVFGVEFDAAFTPNFFDTDEDVVLIDDSNVTTVMGNLMFSHAGATRRFASAGGAGLIRAPGDERGQRLRPRRQQLRRERRRRPHRAVQRSRRHARRRALLPQRPGFGRWQRLRPRSRRLRLLARARSASVSGSSPPPEEAIMGSPAHRSPGGASPLARAPDSDVAFVAERALSSGVRSRGAVHHQRSGGQSTSAVSCRSVGRAGPCTPAVRSACCFRPV